MSDSTQREQLDAILTSLFDIGFWCAVNDSDDTGVHHAIAAREKIEALCQEVAREARLDEQTHTQADIDGNVEYWPDGVTVISQLARIAELTQKPAKETEGHVK